MADLEPLPIVIKLYPNRRLYDGKAGQYRSRVELRTWKERRLPFLIIDSETGDDVTDSMLS